MASKQQNNICEICALATSRYTCPQCSTNYCSLSCYRSKNHQACSEEFYKQQINEQLHNHQAPKGSKERMQEMLKRLEAEDQSMNSEFDNQDTGVEEEESLDSDDEDSLADRMAGVDLNDSNAVWNNLTDEERLSFRKLVESGDVISFVPLYEPWWMVETESLNIVELDDQEADLIKRNAKETSKEKPIGSVQNKTEQHSDNLPNKGTKVKKPKSAHDDQVEIYPNLPKSVLIQLNECPSPGKVRPLKTLLSKSPPESLKYSVVNAVAGFVWTARLFNGDYEDCGAEAAEALLSLSSALGNNKVLFNNAKEALIDVAMRGLQHEWLGASNSTMDRVSKDVLLIVSKPKSLPCYFLLGALQNIILLLKAAKKSGSKKTKRSKFHEEMMACQQSVPINLAKNEAINTAIRKIEFFMSYTAEVKEELPLVLTTEMLTIT